MNVCDLCIYNPPSSCDGKPCTMCPATTNIAIEQKYETVTEFADRCRECGAKYGKLLEKVPKTEWIPVSERLPEENKIVIASTEYGVYPEARYTEKCGWEWAYESLEEYYWAELANVTAWMPLPKTYEPQERSDKECRS